MKLEYFPIKTKRVLALILALAFVITLTACGVSPSIKSVGSDSLFVLFMDVGQADSILIIQGSHSMLVDTATGDKFDVIANYLDSFGINSLDALVLTHPHADHIGSAVSVIEKYTIEQIFMPNALTSTFTFEQTLDAILEKIIKTTSPEPGDVFTLGKAIITFLSPPPDIRFSDLNDSSISFIIEFDDVRMLFTGDSGERAENIILDSGYDIKCDLIKVPHHGSLTASGDAFIEAAGPKWAVFTTAANSPDGLPNLEVIRRYEAIDAKLFFTHKDGSIAAEVVNGLLNVYPYN